MDSSTYVLIVGGGPVGLSAAIELRSRGVPSILISQNLETTTHPKCNSTNSRSLEHFRRLGIAHLLRSQGLPPEIPRASAYVTRFCGYELGTLPRPYSEWPTPEVPAIISQMALERTLRRVAESQPGSAIHFGWQLLGAAQDDAGVVAHIENVTTGERRQIHARFLIGADGASSAIRRQLGFRMIGEDGSEPLAFMGGTMLSYFIRAPGLLAASGRATTSMTWIINAQMRAMMYLQDAGERWIVHYQVPKGSTAQDVDMRSIIHDLLGADVDFEILSGGPWTGGLALVAEHYQSGPFFIAGDAAHLFTPLGGIGMNTGIGDVMNLCWKLAAHYEGWAGAALLDSYERERHPVGVRNSQLGVSCARVMDSWTLPPDLEQPGAAADAARRKLGARIIEEDKPQYQTVGLQLGERYLSSPVVCTDGHAVPPDAWDCYTALDTPGARTPHFWLEPGRSLFDELGPGFTLLDFGAPGPAAAIAQAARDRKVPLKVLALEARPSLYRARLALVRPDHHIAWHGDEADAAAEIIDRVRGALP